jgi:hypothetical protein
MYRHQPDVGATVVKRRMGFASSLVWGLTGIIVTTIVAASGIAIYALRMVDHRADGAVGLVSQILEALPDYAAALPPALADAIDDVRRPEYRSQLAITTKLLPREAREARETRGWREGRTVASASVEVRNNGDETVSLLSMRLVGLDEEGQAVEERCTWAATPIQVEDEWRGPLLPGETRRFVVRWWAAAPMAKVTHEVTDVRVWCGPREDDDADVDEHDSKGTSAAAAQRSRTRSAGDQRRVGWTGRLPRTAGGT